MFKGLTQRAQKVLTILAQDEAKRFHADQLLPEHIIIALLKEGGGLGYKALQKAMIDPANMLMDIEKAVPRNRGGFILGDIPPSPRGKRVLEDSAEEAKRMGHEYIGTEHLLLACARDPEGQTRRYLLQHDVSEDLLQKLSENFQISAALQPRVLSSHRQRSANVSHPYPAGHRQKRQHQLWMNFLVILRDMPERASLIL